MSTSCSRTATVDGDLILLGHRLQCRPGQRRPSGASDVGTSDDPLLFLDSLPVRETRVFIERVLTNYWIYRQRLGQDSPSLDALAGGEWPRYGPQDAWSPDRRGLRSAAVPSLRTGVHGRPLPRRETNVAHRREPSPSCRSTSPS